MRRSKSSLITHHTRHVAAVEFSPDGRLIASGSFDNRVVLCDSVSGNVVCEINHHEDDVWSLSFSPDSSMFASASDDKTVCLSKSDTEKLLKRLCTMALSFPSTPPWMEKVLQQAHQMEPPGSTT